MTTEELREDHIIPESSQSSKLAGVMKAAELTKEELWMLVNRYGLFGSRKLPSGSLQRHHGKIFGRVSKRVISSRLKTAKEKMRKVKLS